MSARLLPCGPSAVLVELADGAERRAYAAALAAAQPDGVVETVPADHTVLVRATDPAALRALLDRLRALGENLPATSGAVVDDREPLEVPVTYDGEDLDEVADLLGVRPREVVERHTGQLWTVEFAGFAPGFGYLLGDDGGLDVPRRASPRTRIPAGSVALAGSYSGIYPQASSGGWQLIGCTETAVWDVERDPPALLSPGQRVRFVEDARS